MARPASPGGKSTQRLPPAESPRPSRRQLIVSSVLLLLWILFLTTIALVG